MLQGFVLKCYRRQIRLEKEEKISCILQEMLREVHHSLIIRFPHHLTSSPPLFLPFSMKKTLFHPFFYPFHHKKNTFDPCQHISHELSVFLKVEHEGNVDLSRVYVTVIRRRPYFSCCKIDDHSENNNIRSQEHLHEGYTCIIKHQPTREH